MGTIEGTLGQALLMLTALAIFMFAVILVLAEANFILGLIDKLVRRWKATRSSPGHSDPPAPERRHTRRPRDGQGVQ